MATENPFPLSIGIKEDSWEKLQMLALIDPKFKYTAEEWNTILQALNYIYENLGGSVPSTTPGYELKYFGAGAISLTEGTQTTPTELMAHINAVGFTVTSGKLLVLQVVVLRVVEGKQVWMQQQYSFKKNHISGTWGTGSTNGVVVYTDLVFRSEKPFIVLNQDSVVIPLGDIGTATIEDYLNALDNTTVDWEVLPDNGIDTFFSCTQSGNEKLYEYVGERPVTFGSTGDVVADTDFDLRADENTPDEPLPISGIKPGGLTGQVYKKLSATDYDADWQNESSGSGHTFGGEISTDVTLDASYKGMQWFRVVGSPKITVPSGLLDINDNPIFQHKTGNPEFLNGSGFSLRGERDAENRFFYNKNYSTIALIDCNSSSADIIGALKGGTIGAVVTSDYTSIAPNTTGDVTVTGVGFSANMKAPAITGNATLNSWTFIDGSTIIMNLTTTGTDGDKLTITYDNGELTTDTDAITLENLANFVIETTSTSATWSPQKVTHTGSTLVWTVSGGASGVYNADKPTIDLSGNSGTAISTVTNITTFTELWAYSLNIKAVDLSVLTGLTDLRIHTNQLTSIDLSNNIALTSAQVYSNPALSVINVAGLASLTSLRIQSCNFSTIDLSTNTALQELFAQGNSLNGIDLSNNTALTFLNLATNGLTALDVSANTLLQTLTISQNNFTVLPNISTLTVLKALDISYNLSLTTVTISNTSIETLSIIGSSITSLDVSALVNLITLNCYNGSLTSLTLPNTATLKAVKTQNNSLTSLDVSNCSALSDVNVLNNSLTVSAINQLIIDMDKNITTGTRYFRYDGNAAPTATETTTNDVLDAYNNLVADGYTIIGPTPV